MATPWRRSAGYWLFGGLVALAGPAGAQSGTVTAERENLRIAPGGNVLAEVMAGTELTLGSVRGNWRQATLDGWVWALSVEESRRGELDLIVLPPEGENLRMAPNGEAIARLRPGMRLQRVEEAGDWLRVRRTGWIWGPSLAVSERAAAPAEASAITAGPRGMAFLNRPAGDTLGRIQQGARAEVLAREGDWARIRVEGWAFVGENGDADPTAVLREVTRTQLAQNPARYRGRMIEWPLQFIALQQAERFRSDFQEGEPFLLARGPGDDVGFVYIAVPPERVEEVRALAPLERISILARVRTGRSALTDSPVLELLQVTRTDTDRP